MPRTGAAHWLEAPSHHVTCGGICQVSFRKQVGGWRSTSLGLPLTHAGSVFPFPFGLCMFGWLTSAEILRNPRMEKKKNKKHNNPHSEASAFPEVKWQGVF